MPKSSLSRAPAPLKRPSASSGSPSIPVEAIDGPLCALSLYLFAAERILQGSEIDRDRLRLALQGAREQVADLARKTSRCAAP